MTMTAGQLFLNGNMKKKDKTLKPIESDDYLERYKRLHGYCFDPCPKCGKQKVVEHCLGRGLDLETYDTETYHYLCCSCGRLVKRIRYLKPKSDEYFEITFDKDGTPIEKELL